MAFEIINETYEVTEGQDPKRFGYLEGYTSNTVGETYLRLNCKELVDKEELEWYKRVYKDIPTIPKGFGQQGCRPLQEGDIVGAGIRLSQKQVKQLIKELKLWLKRGY